MSIEEFLDEMALRKSHLARYQQTRSQFADDCVREILSCLESHRLTTCSTGSDAEECSRLLARFQHACATIYDTIQQFMHHYSKTENISFQIIPEASWCRNTIEIQSIVGTLGEYVANKGAGAPDIGNGTKEYAALCIRAKECYKSIHKILKQKAFEYFPSIVDLPALGLRELDFILFEETHGFME